MMRLLMFLILLTYSFSVFAGKPKLYFDTNNFANCLTQFIDNKMGPKEFHSRLKDAESFDKIALELHRRKKPDQLFVFNKIEAAQSYLEIPLLKTGADYSKYVERGLLFKLLDEAHSLSSLDQDGRYINPIPLVDRVEELQQWAKNVDIETYKQKNKNIYSIARIDVDSRYSILIDLPDRLINYLLSKPRNSIDHFEIIEVATKMYEDDVLVALAVISSIFARESDFNEHRIYNGVLSTRMKPLFINDHIDNIGYNYHFWSYMLHSLQGRYIQGNMFSMLWEFNDKGDRYADIAGLQIGKFLRENVGGATTCKN